MRNAFAQTILESARVNPAVVLVTADIGNRLFDPLKAEFPDRFYNCGVAEANMTGVAAGMASLGLKVFTYTITPFATTRCLEQIRVDLCYHKLPVVVCGVGCGYSYGNLGATHHACEDISLLRSLPEMTVVCPADPIEVRLAIRAALSWPHPMYLRLGKKGEPNVHQSESVPFVIGKALPLPGPPEAEVVILSAGTTLPLALEIQGKLAEQRQAAQVVSFHTVKPLDQDYLNYAFERFRLVVSLEEHSLIGGFGAALAEWLVDGPRRRAGLLRAGTPDRFPSPTGKSAYLRQEVGLTSAALSQRILKRLSEEQPWPT